VKAAQIRVLARADDHTLVACDQLRDGCEAGQAVGDD
jgi:hypothetical protein